MMDEPAGWLQDDDKAKLQGTRKNDEGALRRLAARGRVRREIDRRQRRTGDGY